uniref:F-box domain-containing protein n=1 Tax=Meloidogyne incognita TaxID=6306 RepID=A0A914MW55_MELIC
MNLLPVEAKLDVFKCLNFSQLNNFQLSNRHLCEVIVNYNKELARKVFCSVELVANYVCKELERAPNELDLALSAQNELKYQAALQEWIPFYLDHKNESDASINNKTDEIGNLLFESGETNGTSPKFLRLQLKQYPETVEEMLVFRHWLEKLSQCFIENFKVEQAFINPDILELFFGDSPLKLHTNCFYLVNKKHSSYIRRYEFMYHHVVIHGYRGFYYEDNFWKMRGDLVKEEERYFKMEDLEFENEEEYFKVVEYKMFRVDDPQVHEMMYFCFPTDSKKMAIWQMGEVSQ